MKSAVRSPQLTHQRARLAALMIVALTFAFSLFPLGARATTYSLYEMSNDGAWRSTSGSTVLAQGFSTHSVAPYLSSVRIRLRNSTENGGSSTASTFTVSLWSSSAGLPLAKIADLTSSAQSIPVWGDGSFTFTPVGDLSLGTSPATYFVVVSGNAGGTVGWKCNVAAPTANEPAAGYPMATSTNGGTSWTAVSSGACAGQYFNMTVSATDISSVTTTSIATTTTASTTTTPTTSTAPTTTTTTSATTLPQRTASTSVVVTTSTTVKVQPPLTTSTSTSTTTTTFPAVTETTSASSGFLDNDVASPLLVRAAVGDSVTRASVSVNASGLKPGSKISLLMYSDPVELINEVVPPSGTFVDEVMLPAEVEPGAHTLVLDVMTNTGEQRSIGTFAVDGQGIIVDVMQPAVVSPDVEPTAAILERATGSNQQVYDAQSQPASTGSLAVTATAVVSLLSAGAAATTQGVARQRDAKGKLAGFVTKKLKSTAATTLARGDASRSWRMPFTSRTDAAGIRLAMQTGRFSAAMPRIAVDGSWLRASLGSLGYLPWVVAFVAGTISGVSFESVVAPSATTATVFACIGLLDSGTGLAAWLGTVVGAMIGANLTDWYDVRTLLGLAVLYTGLAPLAHVIRPLRRPVSTREDVIERLFDYAISPVFLAFAGGSMMKALNGLSALKLVSPTNVTGAMWLFGIFLVIRLGIEDLARVLYPERMALVQPQKLKSPSKTVSVLAVVPRSVVLLFVAVPFFGLTWKTLLSTALLAIPAILKPFEDDLPNSPWMHRWLPRGLFRFVCLLILGMWLSSVLVPSNDPQSVRNAAAWLLVPGVAVGVLEGFARQGGDWLDTRAKWSLGALVWLTGVAVITGAVTLF